MRRATSEDIAVLELLAVELGCTSALLVDVELERSRALLAVELELDSAVSVVAPAAAACDRDRPLVIDATVAGDPCLGKRITLGRG